MRKIGPEARGWIDGTNCESEPLLNRSMLSVPLVRRDMMSTTDVTDLTSCGSITSTHDTSTHDSEQITTTADGKK